MSERVTVELPDDLAQRARAVAARTHRPFEEVLIDWLDRAGGEVAIESLPDEELLVECDAQLSSDQQAQLSDLLSRNQDGQLDDAESARLEELMQAYRQGLVRKARALKTAIARGLKPRLN